MAITEVFLAALEIEAAPDRRCYTKQRWAEPWVQQPYFHPLACRFAAAPDLPQAHFEWRYGQGMQAGAGGYNIWNRSDSLLGWYAKIEIGTPAQVTWIGTVTDCDDDRQGAIVDGAGNRTLTGIQRFTALGLEFLLRRQVVDHCWVLPYLGLDFKLPRCLTFNEPNRAGNAGNRSLVRGPRNTYLFAESLDAGQATYWRTIDIVEYLLAYHAPIDRDGVLRIPFRVADASYGVLPDWDQPVIEAHGRSVAELLDALIDRRRFFGYRFTLNAVEEPALEAFTFTDKTIALPGGRFVFESIRQRSLDFDRQAVVRSAVLRDSETHRADQVVCQGARIVVCGSLSAADGTLEADWTAAEQVAYNSASSGVAGYAGLDRHVQERWNSEVRGGDDLSRVFASFRLVKTWHRLLGDGLGGLLVTAYPDPEPGVIAPDQMFRPALRILNWLPIADSAAAEAAGTGTEFRRPFAVVKLAEGGEFDEYQVLDRVALDAGTELSGDGRGIPFSASLRPAEHDAAVWLVISGWPQHALAGGDYVPLDADAALTPSVADWRTDLIVTVAFPIDRHLAVSWPPADQLPAADTLRKMLIDFGDEAQGHWLVKGTVTGTELNGKLIHAAGSQWLRYDGPRLLDLARIAFAWYSQPRQALEMVVRRIFNGLAVGDLLVEIGKDATRTTIQSVVTAIDYDLAVGTTRVTTDFADLDVRLL